MQFNGILAVHTENKGCICRS